MAKIWIWNSMACRRRSASDTFEENGLQIIKTYLGQHGHEAQIFDWANDEGYKSLSPNTLRKINKWLFREMIKINKVNIRKKALYILSNICQRALAYIQKKRMKKKLTSLAKAVKKEKLHIFGIKVWYGEAFTWSKYLTKQIHRFSPETVVIAGGYHASLYEEDILRHSNFDLAVTDEGEYLLHEILELSEQQTGEWQKQAFITSLLNRNSEKPLPGLLYRENSHIRKNARTDCDTEINHQKVIPRYLQNNRKVKVHILMESIGCPWNKCNFCVHNQLSPQYKKRGIDEIMDEIREMIGQGIGLFRFTGSDTPPLYGKQIASAILQNGFHIEFAMGCRAVRNSNMPNVYAEIVECFKVMIKAGLRSVFIGGETGNDLVNEQIMNKGLTSEDIIHFVKAVREAERHIGIKVTVSLALIYPTPLIQGVSINDVARDNLALLKSVRPDSVLISPPAPFKNSKWYNDRGKFGFELGDNFIPEMMEYEYVLYKPLTLWPPLNVGLQGNSFKDILTESQNFRKMVEDELQIPTDLSDEHFLMIRSLGMLHPQGIKRFKTSAMIDIVSSDYQFLDEIGIKVSKYSNNLALKNMQ